MITVLIIAVCYLVGLFLTRVVVLPLLLAKTKILHLMLEDKLTWSPYNVCDKFYSKLYNKPSVSIKNKNKVDGFVEDIVLNGKEFIPAITFLYPLFFVIWISQFCFERAQLFFNKKLTKYSSTVYSSILPKIKEKQIDQAKSSYRNIVFKGKDS